MRHRKPTLDELIARVYRYFPRGIAPDNPAHRSSEESRHLECLLEAAAIACRQGRVELRDGKPAPIDSDVRQVLDSLCSWQPFVERCQQAFPDRVVWDVSGPFFDPGYSVSIAQAGYIPPPKFPEPGEEPPPVQQQPPKMAHDPVLCMVSVLAPVYVVFTWVPRPGKSTQPRYSDFPARYSDRIDTLCAFAEENFGFSSLDEDILRTKIPDVLPSTREMGDTTLADCLFRCLG